MGWLNSPRGRPRLSPIEESPSLGLALTSEHLQQDKKAFDDIERTALDSQHTSNLRESKKLAFLTEFREKIPIPPTYSSWTLLKLSEHPFPGASLDTKFSKGTAQRLR